MTKISINSKKGTDFVYRYGMSDKATLDECYKSYSHDKRWAYNWCLQKCWEEDGCRFRILSWNTFTFTCGWSTEKGIRIETARNSYLITK